MCCLEDASNIKPKLIEKRSAVIIYPRGLMCNVLWENTSQDDVQIFQHHRHVSHFTEIGGNAIILEYELIILGHVDSALIHRHVSRHVSQPLRQGRRSSGVHFILRRPRFLPRFVRFNDTKLPLLFLWLQFMTGLFGVVYMIR